MAHIRIFVSFDQEHDSDLYEQLLEESLRSASGFEVSACSEPGRMSGPSQHAMRQRIASADEVVVICGEHTAESERIDTELRIAQEEKKPYFLLWGRREGMCTRPPTARPSDSMYSWTHEILRTQLLLTLRNAQPREIPDSLKRVPAAAKLPKPS